MLKTGTLQPGRLDSAAFALPKGCARLDILSAAPVRDVSARLWSADDSLIAESDARAAPVAVRLLQRRPGATRHRELGATRRLQRRAQSRARTCAALASLPARREPPARPHAGARVDPQRHPSRQNHAAPLDARAPRDGAALGAIRALRRFHVGARRGQHGARRYGSSTTHPARSSRSPAARTSPAPGSAPSPPARAARSTRAPSYAWTPARARLIDDPHDHACSLKRAARNRAGRGHAVADARTPSFLSPRTGTQHEHIAIRRDLQGRVFVDIGAAPRAGDPNHSQAVARKSFSATPCRISPGRIRPANRPNDPQAVDIVVEAPGIENDQRHAADTIEQGKKARLAFEQFGQRARSCI